MWPFHLMVMRPPLLNQNTKFAPSCPYPNWDRKLESSENDKTFKHNKQSSIKLSDYSVTVFNIWNSLFCYKLKLWNFTNSHISILFPTISIIRNRERLPLTHACFAISTLVVQKPSFHLPLPPSHNHFFVMSQVPLPFCIIVLVISIFGLAGNIQFLVAISRRRVCIVSFRWRIFILWNLSWIKITGKIVMSELANVAIVFQNYFQNSYWCWWQPFTSSFALFKWVIS